MPEPGRSAVVVPGPAVESAVSSWRDRLDRSAAQGMPAHITALYPFRPGAHDYRSSEAKAARTSPATAAAAGESSVIPK